MFGSLNKPLAAHKWYRGISAEDVFLEWTEPEIIRRRLAAIELKRFLKLLPIFFPICALAGLALFACKVASKGHAVSEIPLSGMVVVALALGVVLSLRPLANICILRWNAVVVRLARGGVGRWTGGVGSEIHSDWRDIRTVSLTPHPLVPQVQTVVLTLRDGKETALALPDSIKPRCVLDILEQHGVMRLSTQHADESRRSLV